MSGQQIGTVIGGAIGAYFGGPAGAQLGMAIGGFVGGAVDPDHINGPKIGDGQQQSATDGSPIAWVQGTAMIAGTIVQVGPRRQIRHKDNGKGGPVTTTFTAEQDFAILVCESSELRDSTMGSVLMVLQDGKIVYDVRPGSMMLSDSAKWKANVDFMFGAEDQMPHPTLEAITGVGNTAAYRGSLVAVFKNFDVSQAGDRIPTFQFVVASKPTIQKVSSGTEAWPSIRTFNAKSSGPYTLHFYTGAAPDLFEIWDGDVRLLRSGWYGNPDRQSDLNATLAAHGWPEETIIEAKWPYSTNPPGGWDANPQDWDALSFIKQSDNAQLALKVYSVSPSGWGAGIEYGNSGEDLATVVGRICLRGGLEPEDIEADTLSGISVLGYPIARQSNASDCLLPLLQAYFGYASEYDAKLHFKLYGEDTAVIVDRTDLIEGGDATSGALTSNLRNQSTEFPRRMVGSYMDPAQNYTVVDVAAERLAIDVIAIGDQTLQIPVVMAADDAAKAVDKALKVAYATLEGTLEYAVPFAESDVYLSLACGEALQFQGKRYIVDGMTIGNGTLKLETRYDRQSAYRSKVQAITGNAPTPPASPYSGPTALIPMNLPSLRPQDSYGLYLAAASIDGRLSWRGCTVQASYDEQESWQNALQIIEASVFGVITIDEPVGGESLTVQMNGDLESATDTQLSANANAFALLHASGSEVGQFKTAVEAATDRQYELTDILRGQLGTTEVPAVSGERIIMLDAVYFLPVDISFSGKTIYFRAVGFGEVAEDADVVSITYTPNMTVIHDGGTVTP